jgi:hypothetical protein
LINFAKFWKSPCILIHAEPAYKSAEKAKLLQRSLFTEDDPIPELRATHVTCSEMAREIGFTIFQNMQVPHESIIYKLYESGQHRGEASENLSWWKSITKDTHLPDCKIKIEAMRTGNAIDALLTCL